MSFVSQRWMMGRVVVRALTTTTTKSSNPRHASGIMGRPRISWIHPTRMGSPHQRHWLTTSTSHSVTNIEEDLDAALDSILGDALAQAEDPRELKLEEHMKGSKPIPKVLIEEVRVIFGDAVGSTWIEYHVLTLFLIFPYLPPISLFDSNFGGRIDGRDRFP